jgi:hypothetical protein
VQGAMKLCGDQRLVQKPSFYTITFLSWERL